MSNLEIKVPKNLQRFRAFRNYASFEIDGLWMGDSKKRRVGDDIGWKTLL